MNSMNLSRDAEPGQWKWKSWSMRTELGKETPEPRMQGASGANGADVTDGLMCEVLLAEGMGLARQGRESQWAALQRCESTW